MSIDDLWYKNAVIYCLDVEKYQDANELDRAHDPGAQGVPRDQLGNFVILRTNVPEVLVLCYDWRDTSLVTVHNFSSAKQTVKMKIGSARDGLLVEVFDGRHSKVRNDAAHHIELDGFAWRWFRVGGADNALDRSDLDLTNPMR